MLSLRAGNVSTLCSTIIGTLDVTNCKPFCRLKTRSSDDGLCFVCNVMSRVDADCYCALRFILSGRRVQIFPKLLSKMENYVHSVAEI